MFLYLFHKSNKESLYLSLVCYTAFFSNFLKVADVNPLLKIKLFFIIFILNPQFFLLLFSALYPAVFKKKINKILRITAGIMGIILAFSPLQYIRGNRNIIHNIIYIFMTVIVVYILSRLIKAVKEKKESALIITTGFVFIGVFPVIRYIFNIDITTKYAPYFALLFLLIYALVLARKFSETYYRFEETLKKKTMALKRANSELNKLANLDGLTGIFNKGYFNENLYRKFNESPEGTFTLVMLDLDDFKRFNDRYGHLNGDKLLIKVADILKATVRDTDIPARYGGDEYILVFEDINLEETIKIVKRIKTKINMIKLPDIKKQDYKISCSFGVVANHSNISTIDKMVELADRALYKAKSGGKNLIYYIDQDFNYIEVE